MQARKALAHSGSNTPYSRSSLDAYTSNCTSPTTPRITRVPTRGLKTWTMSDINTCETKLAAWSEGIVSKCSRKSGLRDDIKPGDAQRGLHMRFPG